MEEHLQVTTVCSTEDEARKVARALVEARLAACAQVLGPLSSTYWWQGRVEEAREWMCVAKTVARLYPEVQAAIQRLHSYGVPEILATPVTAGSTDYFAWMKQELRGP